MPQDHRTAELRSIAFHRLVAERLEHGVLEEASERAERWIADGGPVHAAAAIRWRELLADPHNLRRKLVEDSEEMRDLRQNTPFAGALTDHERWQLISQVR